MKTETEEWIEKAESDWAVMSREHQVADNPSYDAVCFHTQQCAEYEANIPFKKTHDLLNLLDDILKIEPSWTGLEEILSELTSFAVAYRYPGFAATIEQSTKSVEYRRLIRKLVRESFGLPAE